MIKILDINLAKLLMRVLKIARSLDHGIIDLKEVLSMLSLFVVDDDIVEYFLNTGLANELLFFIKDDRLDNQTSVINLTTVLIHLLRLKSYGFSKSLKLDFLVFLLRNYERAEEEDYKFDLLDLLRQMYSIKEFKKMLHDEEVVIELKYRSDITELEELIRHELGQEQRTT